MKSLTDATWKDAAQIEVRSLQARIETAAAAGVANLKQQTLESILRQATLLAEQIDKIDEVKERKAPARRKAAAR